MLSRVVVLQCISACLAFTTPSIWNAADPSMLSGAGAGAAGPAVNDFMNWAFGGGTQMVTTPSPMVTYHTAVQAPGAANLGMLHSLPQTPPMGMLTPQIPQQPLPQPTPQNTPQPSPPAKPDTQYSMDEWLRFVAAGVAAAAVQQNVSPSEIQAQVLAAFGGAKTTETTTTTTTPAPTTKAKMTLGELIVSSLGLDKKNETKAPVKQEERGCFYKGQWYKPSSEIERGQSGNWCYGTYCNPSSVVIHWDDHKCKAPITTPPVFNKKDSSNSDPQSVAAQQQTIFNMFAPPSSSSSSSSSSSFNSFGSNGNGGSLLAQTFSTSSSTTTQNPNLGCTYNGRWYAPGTDIENVQDYGRCYGVYCDFKSKIVHWNERCRAVTVAPFTQPAPTQSYQSMQRQMQQLESLLKK